MMWVSPSCIASQRAVASPARTFQATASIEGSPTRGLQQRSPCLQTLQRRQLLAGGVASLLVTGDALASGQAGHQKLTQQATGVTPAALNDYTVEGPYQTLKLPRLEHACAKCFPACTGAKCLLRLAVFYPKRRAATVQGQPFPLAVFTSGFLVPSSSYTSYAQRLASWGWVTVLYDKVESALDNLDDKVSVEMISEIIDWVKGDALLHTITDTGCTFLCGHSRGGKLSVLAAARDERVRAVCLLDPVDNTVWAPLGPGYPSGVQALASFGKGRQPVPLAVVGSGLGGDCVPEAANFRLFFNACTAPSLQVALRDVGHFQFLDTQDLLQRSVCSVGGTSDATVQHISQAIMVAWGEVMCRRQICGSRGKDAPAGPLSPDQKRAAIKRLELYASSLLEEDELKSKRKRKMPTTKVPRIDVIAKNLG